jgi:hypothetical protein
MQLSAIVLECGSGLVTLETKGGPDRSGQCLQTRTTLRHKLSPVAIVHNDDHGLIHGKPHPGSRIAGLASAIPLPPQL